MRAGNMSKYSSPMLLSEWHGSATMFSGFFDPLPADALEDAPFSALVNFIAPAAGPIIGPDKETLPFFVPCLLKVAPLTVKTSAKTGLVEGKQRSSTHVTVAWFLVLDVDGLTQNQFDSLLAQLRDAGLTFLVYSTHSHGRKDKPGIRARLVVPVDRALNAADYAQAWLGFDQIFCCGAIARADASGKNLWQQQGVWVAHPERVAQTFRIVHKAGVASADALIAEGAKVCQPKTERHEFQRVALPSKQEICRLETAIGFIDADDYSEWTRTLVAFKAITPRIGEDAALELALRYSERGRNTEKNTQAQYNPETFFLNASPSMNAEAALGVIYARARDGAKVAVEQGLNRRMLSVHEQEALAYLAAYHKGTMKELLARFGLEI